jgi:5-methylcytosine-specific restriction endonuclease McrA
MERREFDWFTKALAYYRCGGRCECTGCGGCGSYGCLVSFADGTLCEYDHKVARDDDSLENVQVLCVDCHRSKTSLALGLASVYYGEINGETTAYANALINELRRLGAPPVPLPPPSLGGPQYLGEPPRS